MLCQANPYSYCLMATAHTMNQQALSWHRTRGAIIFCLPPHTTQDSQPLDCTVFRPLKRHWTNACHDFQQQNPGMVIMFNFSRIFSGAWLKALTPENIVAGFKKCGIHPFNRDAIPVPDKGSPGNAQTTNPSANDGDTPSLCSVNAPTFTPPQITAYERRHQEGYDIYDDPYYMAWLSIHHPEAVPHNDITPSGQPTSLLQEFSSVIPLAPLDPASPPSGSSAIPDHQPTYSHIQLFPDCNHLFYLTTRRHCVSMHSFTTSCTCSHVSLHFLYNRCNHLSIYFCCGAALILPRRHFSK